jgi:diguanylate cyclase (GGDEF)-like protein
MRGWARWPAAAVVLGALACGLVAWWTDGGWPSTVAYELGGFGACAVALVAVAHRRPSPRWPWVVLALGILGSAIGDLLWDLTERLSDVPGYTSILANLAYLASYPLFVIGVLGLLGSRARRRDALVLIEAVTLATAAWLVLWVLVVHTQLANGGLTFWDWIPTVLYPPLDLVVIVAVWRLGRGSTRRSAPWLLLMGAFVAMFTADLLYALLGMPDGTTTAWLLNLVWLGAYGAIAAAAVHPAMRFLKADPEPDPTRAARTRVVLVTIACASPLALLLFAPHRVEAVTEVVAVTGFLIVLLTALRSHLATEQNRDAAEQLAYRATRDPLTGLANRAALLDHIVLATRRAARAQRSCAVAFLDLDDFKLVNDSLGHAEGDRLLCAVADRLRGVTRAGECVARLGGDEFVVVFEDLDGMSDTLAAAERIVEVLGEPYRVGDAEFTLRASVGVVPDAQRHVDDVGAVLRDADLAMYEAKEVAKGRVCVFAPEMRERAVALLARKSALAHAVTAGDLRLEYQPMFSTADGHQTGSEALVRWWRDGELVLPGEFITLAESTGEIVAIGDWVLRRAVADLAALGPSQLVVSVNVAVRQLREPTFASRTAQLVAAAGVDPARVMLELTESALLEPDPIVDGNVQQLGDAGFLLAIDDFGTGYSSLAYLKRLAVDTIKIDRMFVQDLEIDESDRTLVRTIIRMATELGIGVVAEGVETPEQLALLVGNGCDTVQGYLLARPGPHIAADPAALTRWDALVGAAS